jgi:hypothetical protein
MKKLLIPCLLVLAGCSAAVSVPPADVLTWVHPTQNTDGSALPLAQIASTQISSGSTGGPYGNTVTVAAPANTATIPRSVSPGTVCYVAVTVTVTNQASSPSNEACVTVLAPPKPPTNLTAK